MPSTRQLKPGDFILVDESYNRAVSVNQPGTSFVQVLSACPASEDDGWPFTQYAGTVVHFKGGNVRVYRTNSEWIMR